LNAAGKVHAFIWTAAGAKAGFVTGTIAITCSVHRAQRPIPPSVERIQVVGTMSEAQQSSAGRGASGIVLADRDANGEDEILVSFGAAGLWQYGVPAPGH